MSEKPVKKENRMADDFLRLVSQEYNMPYDATLERHVISMLMNDKQLRMIGISKLQDFDFYFKPYRHAYQAIAQLTAKGENITPILVAEVLKVKGSIEDIGGIAGLTDIYGEAFGNRKILLTYCDRLRNKSTAREVFGAAKEIAISAFDTDFVSETLLQNAQDIIDKLKKLTSLSNLTTYKQVAEQTRAELQAWREGKKKGIPTGIPELDQKLWCRGLAPGELYYFAARTGYGKTALVWQMLNTFAMYGKVGIFFSLEMSAVMLALRSILRMASGLSPDEYIVLSPYTLREIKTVKTEQDLERQKYSEYVYEKAEEMLKQIETWKGWLETTTYSWSEMKIKINQAHNEMPLDYFGGDYIQMVKNQNSYRDRRDLEVAAISRESKEICEKLGIPGVWISQLNRTNKGARPDTSEMKESSYLEQDADFVAFLYGVEKAENGIRPMKLWNAKQRNGLWDWEIDVEFHTRKQMFLTEKMLETLLNTKPKTEEVFSDDEIKF